MYTRCYLGLVVLLIALLALSACAPQAGGGEPVTLRLAVSDKQGNPSQEEVDDIQWRIDDQGLMHFHLVANQNGKFIEVKATYEAKPYQKVGDDASSSSTTPTSPDSIAGDTAWIAYQSNRSGSEGVWLIHPDGTEDHQIATGGPTVLLPDWSPDGKRLLVASRGGDTEPLYEFDLATATLRQLFECTEPCLDDDEPAYSPDGTKVAFIRALLPIVHSDALGDDVPSDCGLWIEDAASGEASQITSNTNPPCDRDQPRNGNRLPAITPGAAKEDKYLCDDFLHG
jgi:hypothetical protein